MYTIDGEKGQEQAPNTKEDTINCSPIFLYTKTIGTSCINHILQSL